MVRRRVAGSDLRFSITIDPSPAAMARFTRDGAGGLGDWRPLFRAMVPILRSELRSNFLGRGNKLDPWPTPSEAYAARKAREGFGSTDMVRTGETLEQLTGPPLSMTKTTLTMGVHTPQARSLQWGNRKAGIKRRAIVGWTPRMQRAALEAANNLASKRLQAAARQLAQERVT